jgi:hypothetical protein
MAPPDAGTSGPHRLFVALLIAHGRIGSLGLIGTPASRQRWYRRVDRGGLSPACYEPVSFTDLLEDANQ